jgi:hypothetical protein
MTTLSPKDWVMNHEDSEQESLVSRMLTFPLHATFGIPSLSMAAPPATAQPQALGSGLQT